MTIQHERRKVVGKNWLLRLMGLLFSTLLLSILLFMMAFLLQAWVVAYAQTEPRPVLVAAAVIVSALVLSIIMIVVVTTYHAVMMDNSPFETPLSNAIRLVMHVEVKEKGRLQNIGDWLEVTKEDSMPMEYRVLDPTIRRTQLDLYLFDKEILKTFAGVVMNTAETEVLEKAVPSFRFHPWFRSGDSEYPLFEAVYTRFIATDTSIRVKETLAQQIISFGESLAYYKADERGENKIVKLCRQRSLELCGPSHDSFFRPFVAFASMREHNGDLQAVAQEGYYDCMGRALACLDRNQEIGDREDVIASAFFQCLSLIQIGREKDVITIISDRQDSILRSLIRSPFWSQDFTKLLIRGREDRLLKSLFKFISGYHLSFSYNIFLALDALSFGRAENYTLPVGCDLSRALFVLSRRHEVDPKTWGTVSRVVMFYLDRGAFDQLSDVTPARAFFNECTYSTETSEEVSRRASFYLKTHASLFTERHKLLRSEIRSLIADLSVFSEDWDSVSNSLETLTKKFVDACDRCNLLILRDGPLLNLTQDDLSMILKSLLRNPVLSWTDLEHWMSSMPWENEDIWGIISRPENLVHSHYIGTDLLPLELLCYLDENDFDIPHDYDFSPFLGCVTRHTPRCKTWRKYSDILMRYISRFGAFETLHDHDSARKFFNLCAEEYRLGGDLAADYWTKTNAETRIRAIQFLRKLQILSDDDSLRPSPRSKTADLRHNLRSGISKWFGSTARKVPVESTDLHTTIQMGDVPKSPPTSDAIQLEDLPENPPVIADDRRAVAAGAESDSDDTDDQSSDSQSTSKDDGSTEGHSEAVSVEPLQHSTGSNSRASL
ncbi:hypothetical protein SISSUDRAFT_1053165 [Sistotremastrum suecicum HHB10207 ss-3]|uniref:Uncharacterized protein n=1 Tax=Sistotremastrum suecicum HHB10207 ss-3 TaxID=1314776 RepID=A0A165ZDL6_9AGAM|nr:hypothetical protein SISSUDRAFT_1053165 [Sistotremastrum suecicum HHB10207 ss-3]